MLDASAFIFVFICEFLNVFAILSVEIEADTDDNKLEVLLVVDTTASSWVLVEASRYILLVSSMMSLVEVDNISIFSLAVLAERSCEPCLLDGLDIVAYNSVEDNGDGVIKESDDTNDNVTGDVDGDLEDDVDGNVDADRWKNDE